MNTWALAVYADLGMSWRMFADYCEAATKEEAKVIGRQAGLSEYPNAQEIMVSAVPIPQAKTKSAPRRGR